MSHICNTSCITQTRPCIFDQQTLFNYCICQQVILICFLLDIKKTDGVSTFGKIRSEGCGPCSSVSIAIGYGLEGPGIKPQWERHFLHLSRPALGPTQPPVQWVPGLSWG
jgi:hypothetical protein